MVRTPLCVGGGAQPAALSAGACNGSVHIAIQLPGPSGYRVWGFAGLHPVSPGTYQITGVLDSATGWLILWLLFLIEISEK